jgi:DNA polymerase-3 subunit alpha
MLGVIITPSDITDFVPVYQRFRLVCTQFDNSVVETAGLLKWISWFENLTL